MAGDDTTPDAGEARRVLERRPPRPWMLALAVLTMLLGLGAVVWGYLEYAGPARTPLLALAMAVALFAAAATVLLAFRAAYTFATLTGPRHAGPPAQEVLDDILPELAPEPPTRRRFFVLLGGAATALLGGLLLPLRSLGTWPGRVLRANAWRSGVRLQSLDGRLIRPGDLVPGSATPVVPVAAPDDGNSLAVLVRLRPATPDAAPRVVCYSRICTHAGCPVSIYRDVDQHLVCPCHRSVFDAADGARVLRGPASQPLPELPVGLDDEGYLVALGGYDRPIGPVIARSGAAPGCSSCSQSSACCSSSGASPAPSGTANDDEPPARGRA